MAVLEKAQFEDITDRVAAMVTHQMSALLTQPDANATLSLRDIIDALGHPAAEICLEEAALALDHEMYPEHLYYLTYPTSGGATRTSTTGLINGILSSSVKRKFVTDLNSFVRSSDGGSLASLAAAFTATGARIHPAFGEVMMKNLGTSSVLSGGRAADVFAPEYNVMTPDAVYVYATSAWADETTDATDADASDVDCFVSNGDMVAIGSHRKFSSVALQIGTLASATITPEFYYSLGGANYGQVTGTDVDDDTVGLTKSNLIQLTNLAGWAPTYLDMAGDEFDAANRAPMYWIIIKRTNSAAITPPSLTMVHIVPEEISVSATGRPLGLVTQPPLAIIRITAASTMEVVSTYDPELTYFDYPEKLRLKALALQGTPAAATFTISYTDASGVAATQIQSAWSTPAVPDSFPAAPNYLTLAAVGGIQNILTTGWVVSTTMTNGVFAVTNDLERTPTL